jgi:hypothetical protein
MALHVSGWYGNPCGRHAALLFTTSLWLDFADVIGNV